MKNQKTTLRLVIMAMMLVFGMGIKLPVKAQEVKQIQVTINSGDDVRKTIQKALDQALEDQSGNTLYEVTLPVGTYKLNQMLRVYSYTTVKMNGCTLIRDCDTSMIRIGDEAETFKGYSGHHDITFEGGTIDGNGKKGKVNISMVRLGHASNITFNNVTFKNAYNSHHVELAACEKVTFEGCTFKEFYCSKSVAKTGNNEALQFDVLHNKKHFPQYPGFDDTPCRDITVNNCTFKDLQRGLGTHSGVAGSYFSNMTFTNNTFTNIKGYAMMGTNYINSNFSNNTITNCGSGILFRSMVQGYNNFYTPLKKKFKIQQNAKSIIANNVISVTDHKYKTTAYGISLYGENLKKKQKNVPKGNYTLKGVTVSGNKITMKNSGYGIWLQTADSNKIINNKVTMDIKSSVTGKGNSDCIRLVSSRKNLIEKNTLTQKRKKNKKTEKACGIVLTTKSSATIKNNTISNSPKDGIFVVTKCTATIIGNKVTKSGRYALNVCEHSTVISKKNKFSKSKKRHLNTYDHAKIKKK